MTEKELLIDALQHELRVMRTEVQKDRSEASFVQEQLRLRINDLESSVGELVSFMISAFDLCLFTFSSKNVSML